MKTTTKIILITLPVAVVALILSRVIWPDPEGWVGPNAALLPHFIFIGILESVSFGLGIAFLILGWSKFRDRIKVDALTTASFAAVVWLLISWWPHDNMHRANFEGSFAGLLQIEYTFHATLILAGFILALYFWKKITQV